VVRPSVASLNSLAEVLRPAQPLYIECRSILNYLDNGDGIVILPTSKDSMSSPDAVSVNKDADSIAQASTPPAATFAPLVILTPDPGPLDQAAAWPSSRPVRNE
jgi:hypothetical protein